MLLTIAVMPAVLCFSYWISLAALTYPEEEWKPLAISTVLTIGVMWFLWKNLKLTGRGVVKSVALGAILVGSIGFSVGFFGPMVLAPGANQGPLLGILITGPLGIVIGAGMGVVWWHRSSQSRGVS